MKKIQKEHVALVIKYTGISFITGGLSHGFFSGERQIITSLVGIGFFIIWTLMEQKTWEKEYLRTILFSSILAVAIGALTGGLQHFPDSPGRSLWIVPLWFLISVYAYISLEKENFIKKTHLIYTWVWFLLFITISLWFYWVVAQGYFWESWHAHGDTHHEAIETLSELDGMMNDSENTIIKVLPEDTHVDGDGHDH